MSKEKDAKLKALQMTLDRLDKTYGKGSVMKMGDQPVVDVDVIPTGSLSLDLALGINGLPKGRVVMLGSPVRGSWIAQKVSEWPIVSPLLAKSMPNALSGMDIPEWKTQRDWGMIAGTKGQGLGLLTGGMPGTSDGTVLLEETIHPKQKEHIQVDKSHTALLFSKEVSDLTSHFLNSGSFK